MDSPNGKGSGTSRPSSTRRSRSLRLSTGHGVIDDDYDLSAMMVADGFRPSETAASSTQPSSNPRSDPSLPSDASSQSTPPIEPAQLAGHTAEITSGIRNRPSSISKPPRAHDSLALRNEGSSVAGRPHMRNVASVSSDSPVIRAESPYTGPSGPSHPYQMYPQRTLSVATTSTTANAVIPEDRAYGGPSGPTHPYALYTQNTTSTETTTPPIPVGFNGMGAGYQRQLGPDGEEAGDLIGPLGHMEELPPYTRYPDTAFVPKPTTETPSTEPSSPDRNIPGAGGIGMATRDPEFSSTDDDLALPRTRPSVRSNTSETSHHDINTAAVDVAEKPVVNKWQRRAKKKLWGIVPYWAICLMTVGLVVMGIIMGAVIGTIFSRDGRPGPPPPENAQTSSPTTTSYEPETLTAIPTDLPPMSTGHYALPNIDPKKTVTSCFNNSEQSAAWTCKTYFPLWSIEVKEISTPKSQTSYKLILTPKEGSPDLPWGIQPPDDLPPQLMVLVNDTSQTDLGPAWWFSTTYNKTVIVPEKEFPPYGKRKRGWDDDDDDDDDDNDDKYPPPYPHRFKKQSIHAMVGEKPWICTWPSTSLEIFIYPNQGAKVPSYTPSATTTYGSATTTATSYDPYSTEFGKAVPYYPKVFKMLERRLPATEKSVASCIQVEVYEDGECKSLEGTKEVIIEEVDAGDSIKLFARSELEPEREIFGELTERGSLEAADCSCLWMSNY
ncbi:hypothetical protein CEP52_001328 [Fusarium oligoseptatum]|uniref:DUF7820 domain-containing protein n=1 Tax=Fusarium oligoseptatum TaxID=2604345 RepID=A0A428UJS5_9HYPO|nr:hypothetical protein CEP52_001328 [Fusarium oligoseptatum]